MSNLFASGAWESMTIDGVELPAGSLRSVAMSSAQREFAIRDRVTHAKTLGTLRREPLVMSCVLEVEDGVAYPWMEVALDEHGLTPPMRVVATIGDEVVCERWFRAADAYCDDGYFAVAFGSFEVDIFDELYLDLGGEG
jgi:hypothetical protein